MLQNCLKNVLMGNSVYCHNLQLKFAVNKVSEHSITTVSGVERKKNTCVGKRLVANSLVSSTAENVLENASS